MLRDSRAGSSYRCLENPRPTGAEPSLTEDVTSPFQAEPKHMKHPCTSHLRHTKTLILDLILGTYVSSWRALSSTGCLPITYGFWNKLSQVKTKTATEIFASDP